MKTKIIFTIGCMMFLYQASAQIGFDPTIEFEEEPSEVVVPASPIQKQVIFIGGHDSVQTTQTYGNPAGAYPAKQWHDFIGFTPDLSSQNGELGWLSVNHERVVIDNHIGDGGGMTVFKIKRDPVTDSIIVVEQTLADGRSGKFFNVDFANTVGETSMNCGGIQSDADGRIWTAEEWFRIDNEHIYDDGDGITDTSDFTITGSGIPFANGQTIRKYENFNWMVEIDPVEAVAVRKQYNWGRQPFEGGVVMPDNKTVYLGADNTPGIFTKFVANTPGDFTSGDFYVYREDDQNLRLSHGASLTNTYSEISAYDATSGKIFSTSSGNQGIYVSQVTASGLDSSAFIDLSMYGTPTSVAVSNGYLAAVIPAAVTQDPGSLVMVNLSTNAIENVMTVGSLPDMVTFSPNGAYIIVANEGEPSDDYTVDPDGTVSIVDISGGIASYAGTGALKTDFTR